MTHSVVNFSLGAAPPGTQRTLRLHRFGNPGARPLVYVQGGLHAEEVPGMLAAERLIRRLIALDAAGQVAGEIRVIPAANPIGLDQRVFDGRIGRFDLTGAGNFNRGFADVSDAVAGAVKGRLGADAQANVALIRTAAKQAVSSLPAVGPTDHLRRTLLAQAIDADIVLDLHCDDIAPVHLYLGTPLWPDAEDLARCRRAEAILLAEDSGGHPFVEACSALWWRLADRLGTDHPIPAACLASTIELRGMADVDLDLADADAVGIVHFLMGRGAIVGDPPPLPPLVGRVTPLAGVDMVTSPATGILVRHAHLGDWIEAGQPMASVLDPQGPADADDPPLAATVVRARAAGRVWSLASRRLVDPGTVIAKIAGDTPLADKTEFLLTP